MAGRFEEAAGLFREMIFQNPYLIPFVLGKQPKTLPNTTAYHEPPKGRVS